MENVVLVDIGDNQIGICEKLAAHRKGLLHRAVSVFIFNSKNELLLQKRNINKYHSGGLWSNTCCSHPRPGESNLEAARRRLKEEMGIALQDLTELGSFIYETNFSDLKESELDHVFTGECNDDPVPNPDEAEDWKWISLENLKEDIKNRPENYASWFKIIIEKFFSNLD